MRVRLHVFFELDQDVRKELQPQVEHDQDPVLLDALAAELDQPPQVVDGQDHLPVLGLPVLLVELDGLEDQLHAVLLVELAVVVDDLDGQLVEQVRAFDRAGVLAGEAPALDELRHLRLQPLLVLVRDHGELHHELEQV